MASRFTLSSCLLARLPLMAGAAVAARKPTGTAGLHQPAAHS
ncbi:MAG: hypothetical protein ACT6SG_10515 [Hydrogenophaga sp.]|nr:hypothetical protein [Hydrogenophaga sp.]